MKKNIRITQIIFVLIFSFILSGCFHADEDKSGGEEGGITEGAGKVSGVCKGQYEEILSNNKADFRDCKFSVRSDSFEKKEVPRKQNNTVLIFDASGSMAGRVEGRTKMDIAKEAVAKFVGGIDGTDVNLSVIVYGHKGSNAASSKSVSCAGIEEVYYLGSANSNVVRSKIAPLSPTGWTPIADSFKKAEEVLSKYVGENYNNSIILVSDGKETCDGKPGQVAERLKNSNLKVRVNVIGFDVGGDDEAHLKEVAKGGGGDYFSVKSAIELENALERHRSFLEEFDYKMKNVEMQLQDISNFTDKYFDCLMRLKKEEAGVMLDIYADEDATEQCQSSVEGMYYSERHNVLESELESSFDAIMKDWRDASAFK
jgi:Mg-chelatase subunit ChlD